MNAITLARAQFAITTIYHFFFVPLTLGLSVLVAVMETMYVRTGNELYKRMTKFWGKLFLINFAMGVVTGIVMEFQFGMNWSEYARYVGDVFGAPLAIEALSAFFLESTFLGIWIFGWEKLPKKIHAATMWLVAIGSNLSALWILVANSFMHEPVGYAIQDGRAIMNDFFALLSNPHVWVQFPHIMASGMATAAFFVLGISAYHLARKQSEKPLFQRSFRYAAIYGLIATVLVGIIGHQQAQHMVRVQPMKMAAAEGLWESEDPASLSLFTIANESEQRDIVSIRIPRLLSLLAYNRLEGEVRGMVSIQAEYEQRYGPGDYIPSVTINYWAFRIMVGIGLLMIALALLALFTVYRGQVPLSKHILRYLPWAIALPYIANTAGWILTEIGRQPWIVFGLQRTQDAVSPNVSTGMLAFTLVIFTLIYGVLMAVDVYLLAKYARRVDQNPEPFTSLST